MRRDRTTHPEAQAIVRVDRLWLTVAILMPVSCGCRPEEPPAARFVREIAWSGQGQWLKAELHIHTKFSDGSASVAEVAAKAREFGCDVIAITDHGDRQLKAATAEYAAAIEETRRAHPELIVLGGLEWNVPPSRGDEHANVLVSPGPKAWATLERLKRDFDDFERPALDAAMAEQALRWLAQQTTDDGSAPLVFYNHPSRKRAESITLADELTRWRGINDLTIGFEGAPGHQRCASPGDYQGKQRTIDRWDPAVARTGDAWDRLLGQGLDLWAAMTSADFHTADPKQNLDYWPGEFAETWIYAPDRTAAGVLQALRAGCYFAAHGHIVREVELLVDAPGLPRPAGAGEVIEVPEGMKVRAALRLTVPAKDWKGQPNRIDQVELIAVTAKDARVVAAGPVESAGPALDVELDVAPEGMVLRARGRRQLSEGSGLAFYTNPVRIVVRESPSRGTPRPGS